MSVSKRAIISATITPKKGREFHNADDVYAILKRYSPEVKQVNKEKCVAELTGLRTFFKMTYKEMVEAIIKDLKAELNVSVRVKVVSSSEYDDIKIRPKKATVSTYAELNDLFSGESFDHLQVKRDNSLKQKLTIPFLGRVE